MTHINRKTKNFLLTFFIALLSIGNYYAQVPILEKPYEVSNKAKRGYLGGIEMNKEKETIDMVYILPSLIARKVKTETYTYDKDLNLLNTVKEEEWLEKVKTRYKWFNYKGENWVYNSLTASIDLSGGLVFRKKATYGTYIWATGSYYRNVKQLEKVKPKTENDLKYKFRCAYEIEADSTVLVIVGKPEKKTNNETKFFEVMSCDNQVNITTVDKFEFQYPQSVIFSAPLQDEMIDELTNDDSPRDWIVVFAPSGQFKKDADPKPTNFTYLRLSPKGKIIEKFSFNSPSNGWRIQGAYEKEGSVFLYGSAMTKDPEKKYMDKMYGDKPFVASTSADADEKAMANSTGGPGAVAGSVSAFSAMGAMDYGQTQDQVDLALDELKYTNFQVGKITDGKFDFISSPNIEEFEQKQAKPADQKKFVKFDGKKFIISGISFASSGDIFISGQDFTKKDDKRIYKGIYMFQFAPSGELKRNYGVFVDQKKKSGFFNKSPLTSDMILAKNFIQESGDGKQLYWLLKNAKSVREESHTSWGTKTTTWTPLYGFDYGSINIADGSLSEFKTFGEDEKRSFYLFNNTNSYKMANYLYFFSEDTKGGKILLTRMDIAK
ncbi:MAG: hypothetical protein K0Q95_2315 [Bacteroidota bacterium]|jgi:hypothetical protein|nr:hypothetical protein [Bacteroidota bacterium]